MYFCTPNFTDENICSYLFFDTFIAGHLRPFCLFAQEEMAVALVKLVAIGCGHFLRPHFLGNEHSRAAAVKSLLLYINMYSLAEIVVYVGFCSFQNTPYLLEGGGEG